MIAIHVFLLHVVALAALVAAHSYRPVVLWHGMLDWYNSPAIHVMIRGIKDVYPGIQVYSIRVSNNSAIDEERSWFSVINEDVSMISFLMSVNTTVANVIDKYCLQTVERGARP